MPTRWRTSALIRARARELRRELTYAERRLWHHLRSRQLFGAHFRKQHAVGPFIIDFVCARAHLAIEIDGDSHIDRDHYDEHRTRWLERVRGYRVLRFSDRDVLQHIEGVLETIGDALKGAGEI